MKSFTFAKIGLAFVMGCGHQTFRMELLLSFCHMVQLDITLVLLLVATLNRGHPL